MADASHLLHDPAREHPGAVPEGPALLRRSRSSAALSAKTSPAAPAAPVDGAAKTAAEHRHSRHRVPADHERAGLTAIGALLDGLMTMLDGSGR